MEVNKPVNFLKRILGKYVIVKLSNNTIFKGILKRNFIKFRWKYECCYVKMIIKNLK